jgi:hypothetical protein
VIEVPTIFRGTNRNITSRAALARLARLLRWPIEAITNFLQRPPRIAFLTDLTNLISLTSHARAALTSEFVLMLLRQGEFVTGA